MKQTAGLASLFYQHITRTIYMLFCYKCGSETKHTFDHDSGIWEYYRCCECGHIHGYAVR